MISWERLLAPRKQIIPAPDYFIVDDHTDVASGDHAVCKHGIEKDPRVLTIVHVDG